MAVSLKGSWEVVFIAARGRLGVLSRVEMGLGPELLTEKAMLGLETKCLLEARQS